jgi:integrase
MARASEGWSLIRDERTGIHTVRFSFAGRRYHRSTGERDRGKALRRAQEIFDEVTLGRAPANAAHALSGVPLAELAGAWLSAMANKKRPATLEIWEMYARAHFGPFFRNDAAALCDERQVARYIEKRLREVCASTVRKECSAIQSLLNWCASPAVGHLEKAPRVPRPDRDAKGTRAQTVVRVDLTAAQAEALIEALPEYVRAAEEGGPRRPCRAFFRVLWETGLRCGTLWRLEAPHDFYRGARELVIRDEADKAAYGRTLPLTPAARAALDSVCPKRGELFPEVDYRAQLEKAALAIGIAPHLASHVSHHDFRHGRTTHLLDEGGSLTGVGYLVGHKRATTTDGYAHARRSAAVEALALSGHQTGHQPAETTKPAEGAGSESVVDVASLRKRGLEPPRGLPTRSLEECGARLRGVLLAFPSSREVTEGRPEADSGHRVRLAEAALAVVEAVQEGSPFLPGRALDLAELVADELELDDGHAGRQDVGS